MAFSPILKLTHSLLTKLYDRLPNLPETGWLELQSMPYRCLLFCFLSKRGLGSSPSIMHSDCQTEANIQAPREESKLSSYDRSECSDQAGLRSLGFTLSCCRYARALQGKDASLTQSLLSFPGDWVTKNLALVSPFIQY